MYHGPKRQETECVPTPLGTTVPYGHLLGRRTLSNLCLGQSAEVYGNAAPRCMQVGFFVLFFLSSVHIWSSINTSKRMHFSSCDVGTRLPQHTGTFFYDVCHLVCTVSCRTRCFSLRPFGRAHVVRVMCTHADFRYPSRPLIVIIHSWALQAPIMKPADVRRPGQGTAVAKFRATNSCTHCKPGSPLHAAQN